MSYIQIRIDDELKEEAVKLFNELGLDLSTAIRLFLKQSIDDKKMPFKLKAKGRDTSKDAEYRLRADVLVSPSTNPFEVMDEFMRVCQENEWHCLGGSVKCPSKVSTLSKPDVDIYYHGSPYKIDILKEGFDFTPFKELAISFGSKPSHISINEGKVSHDGVKYPVYLYQIDEDIRSSERVFWRQVLDIFATSIDYDSKNELSQKIFKIVQNKMHWATHGHTATKIIIERANAEKDFMGLTTFNGDYPTKEDTEVVKNYLSKDELDTLNRIFSLYLDFAELMAKEEKPMTMNNWLEQLDYFLKMSKKDILTGNGTVSHIEALEHARKEYNQFSKRILTDPTETEKSYFEKLQQLMLLERKD